LAVNVQQAGIQVYWLMQEHFKTVNLPFPLVQKFRTDSVTIFYTPTALITSRNKSHYHDLTSGYLLKTVFYLPLNAPNLNQREFKLHP
jgi:hypothetical protein